MVPIEHLGRALAILTGGSNANFLQVTLALDVASEPALGSGSAAVVTLLGVAILYRTAAESGLL